ncbi:unnamed protein product [Caenorhabditis auriculariae]|uniref:Dynactin subunit 6 n=1 Tax=Caenorhabditis auriculariae TaxID=2777116 RepID=A0A8S1GMH3_9PELO|nr:unnamed protein product [Caenorhabditis auriculariae]
MTASAPAAEGITIAPTAIVCRDAILEGNVTIGDNCIIHPLAIIRAKSGPILIGANNIVEERAIIENRNTDGKPMVIGDGNTFEVQSQCRALCIGRNNVMGVRSELEDGCVVLDDCTLGVGCRVVAGQTLDVRSVVFGSDSVHRIAADGVLANTTQLELLRVLLPSYHYLQKSSTGAK